MNSKDWISFRDRKPLLGQDVLLLLWNGLVCREKFLARHEATHWQPWAEPEREPDDPGFLALWEATKR